MGKHIRKNTQILFGKRLRALREAGNFTQDQIGDATKVDQSYIAKIEAGENSIGINYVSVLADFFGLDDYQMFLYKEPIPDGEILERNVIKFLKRNDIDPATFFKKGLLRYLEKKVLPSRFLSTPKFTKDIALHLKDNYQIEVSTSAISQALDGLCKRGLIEKIPTDKKSKFQYKKK